MVEPERGEKSWLRSLYWAASVMGPVAAAFAFMDLAAHQGSPALTPMIGLEGGGAPNAVPFMLIALAFLCATAALVARSMIADPRPSLPGAVLLSMLCFILSTIASKPIFHAKWERDCEHGVGRACWAIGALTTDPGRKAELFERACEHGDPRGCPGWKPEPPPGASASAP